MFEIRQNANNQFFAVNKTFSGTKTTFCLIKLKDNTASLKHWLLMKYKMSESNQFNNYHNAKIRHLHSTHVKYI